MNNNSNKNILELFFSLINYSILNSRLCDWSVAYIPVNELLKQKMYHDAELFNIIIINISLLFAYTQYCDLIINLIKKVT